MLGSTVIILCLLLSQVNGLIKTDAKCAPGYDWTYSSIGQSPCDVAAELGSVCSGGQFNLLPLDTGFVYTGPTSDTQNSCRCSSVYYSLLSACAYCQNQNYLRWSSYITNCSVVYVSTFSQQIPVGVLVPAYAYQNISDSDQFNATLAASTGGVESSRPSSASSTSSMGPSAAASKNGTSNHTGVIVGGVVGGVALLGILGVLILYFIFRAKRKQKQEPTIQKPTRNVQKTDMSFTPNTTGTLVQTMTPMSNVVPTKLYDPNDPSTFPSANPGLYDSYPYVVADPARPPSSQNYEHPMGSNSRIATPGPQQYSGAPEV